MVTAAALIVAAGRGHRVGGPVPKQYRPLGGRAVLGHSIGRFAAHPRVDWVRVVIAPADRALYDDAARASGGTGKLLAPVPGGATRQDSARLGLESFANAAPDLVLIHDGARPLVPAAVIDGALDALGRHDGAVAALALSDSLKRALPDAAAASAVVAGSVPRDGLWRAQTPQGFRYPAILDAHRAAAGGALTDDAAVAERAGLSVALTPGDEDNLKITTERDFARAERILAARDERPAAAAFDTRVGMGFDVHRFGPGDHLMLGGVAVPHDHGVVSHSDGDVVLHAVVDAIPGRAGGGRYRQPLPALRRGLAGRRFDALRGPRAGAAGGARRAASPCRCHADLPAAQDRPASAGHGGAARRGSRPPAWAHRPEGHHDGAPRLHRAGRRHRGAGGRHGPTARRR